MVVCRARPQGKHERAPFQPGAKPQNVKRAAAKKRAEVRHVCADDQTESHTQGPLCGVWLEGYLIKMG